MQSSSNTASIYMIKPSENHLQTHYSSSSSLIPRQNQPWRRFSSGKDVCCDRLHLHNKHWTRISHEVWNTESQMIKQLSCFYAVTRTDPQEVTRILHFLCRFHLILILSDYIQSPAAARVPQGQYVLLHP